MTRNIVIFLLLLGILEGCKKNRSEDPYEVAAKYCDCVSRQLKNTKDSVFVLSPCENEIFSKSRMMKIWKSSWSSYTTTPQIDSSKEFAKTVKSIIDTMCFEKIKMEIK
jgi:hypothetical protein